MDLRQEYYNRVGVKEMPVQYGPGKNFLLLKKKKKSDAGNSWSFISINFCKTDNHPGFFKFIKCLAVRDGSNPLKAVDEKKIEWDDWETYIDSWVKENKDCFVPIERNEKTGLDIWEIFIYSYDTWLTNNLSDTLKDKLCTTVDEEESVQVRVEAMLKIEEFLKVKNRTSHVGLNSIRAYVDEKNYAEWLAKLFQ